MDLNYTGDQTFEKKHYTVQRLPKGEYGHCIFEACDFSEGYRDNTHFTECRFIDCHLSTANIAHSLFREVRFTGSEMLGLRFKACNDFLLSLHFQDCSPDLGSFYKLPLKGTEFEACRFVQTDFVETDLREASLSNCNLDGARFDTCRLQGADFRKAVNFRIDPERNHLRQARFSREGLEGLLLSHEIIVE